MNVAEMLTGFAFKTTLRQIAQAKAKEVLAAGRAKRSAMAAARRAEIPALVLSGKTAKELAAHYGLALMTIRDEIAEAAKDGKITKEQANAALPPIIHQRDRVYKTAHAASIELRSRLVEYVTPEPRTMNELSAKFELTRSAIMTHIEALELDGKVRRINGYPYKIAARKENAA